MGRFGAAEVALACLLAAGAALVPAFHAAAAPHALAAASGGVSDGEGFFIGQPLVFIPPVDAPITRRFSPPLSPFGPGHRGVDFEVPEGTEVIASGDGVVTFAGPVAGGGLFVTLSHEVGLETTYSFLSRVDVPAGRHVGQAEALGLSGSGHPERRVASLHFGVRQGGAYLDPETLFAGGPADLTAALSLAPVIQGPGEGPAPRGGAGGEEGLGFVPTVGSKVEVGLGAVADVSRTAALSVSEGLRAAGQGLRSAALKGADLLWRGLRMLMGLFPAARLVTDTAFLAFGAYRGVQEQAACQKEGGSPPREIPTPSELSGGGRAPPPPNRNVAVLVAGLGSSTAGRGGEITPDAAMYGLDFRTLGFAEERIFHYSYKGIELRREKGPYRLHAPYTARDTFESIPRSAAKLGRQIEEIHRLFPDAKIDLVAHSQGGLVAQYYLEETYRQANPDGIVIDHLVTIASPHHGADLAGFAPSLSDNLEGRLLLKKLDWLAKLWGLPPPSSPAARQLAERSSFIRELEAGWDPLKVNTTTIASAFDPVVASRRTRLEGAANYTVVSGWVGSPFAHAKVINEDAT
ncbi:MAG: peptidoglycan DD-metalloendopeptidase family protein, partial [Actinomycetota bacterium]